jgi:dTDP-4-amino-4,6-dideoxygalactose transaminase
MKINFNQLDRAYFKYKTEFDLAVSDVLSSGIYVLGNKVNEFEENFKNYIGAKYCVGLNSGLDALILAFRALNISHGDEVIVQANTYIASVLGITENHATPVFVEPDEYYNIDANKIEKAITKKTKAILVVHLFGQTSNMVKIKELAEKYKLYIVEDCAQSHGSVYNGQISGTFGDIGCFSFYPTKNIGAYGDAGAVVTNNEKLYESLKMLRNYGSKIKYQNEILGVNSRLDEIQAALLTVKLKYYPELLNDRLKIVDFYLNNIRNSNIKLPIIRDKSNSVFHLFVINTLYRKQFQDYLTNNDIGTQIHYPIPPHLSNAYRDLDFKTGSFPITESYANQILSLPLYDGMTIEEAMYVVDVINRFNPHE